MNDNNISATKKFFVPDLNQRPMDTTPPTVHRSELSKDTHYNASGEIGPVSEVTYGNISATIKLKNPSSRI